MADLTLRNVKGTPLTNQELDDNFTNLNSDKVETQVLTDVANPSGFLTRSNTLTFDDGTRTFTVVGSFDYYLSGVKYTNADISIQITATTGIHFIYINTSNQLVDTLTPWDLSSGIAPIAVIYWDGTSGRVGEERHSAARNPAWHNWAHETIGTRYQTGLGGSFTNSTFSIAAGVIHDEDIHLPIAEATTTLLVYRNSPSTNVVEDASITPYKLTATVPQYDNNGTLTGVTNNYYFCSYVYATNDINDPIYSVLGQGQYQQLSAAQAASPSDLLIPQLPVTEFKLLYKVIYRYQGGSVVYTQASDYRLVASLPGGNTAPSSHNNLLGLQGGSATERYHLTEAEYNAVIALITP